MRKGRKRKSKIQQKIRKRMDKEEKRGGTPAPCEATIPEVHYSDSMVLTLSLLTLTL